MLRLLITLAIVFVLAGCNSTSQKAWSVENSWFNEPSDTNMMPWDWNEVAFSEVGKGSQKHAQRLLQDSPVVEISKEQMVAFAANKLDVSNDVKFYLLRGVYLNEHTGSFSVYSRSSLLWVYHGSLGRNLSQS